jgi:hypothetical protein
MRARVLSFDLGHEDASEDAVSGWSSELEDELNKWLKDAGAIKIENVSVLGQHAIVIFYSDLPSKDRPAQTCAQCRKNPPMKGLKVCEGCREYQKDYRQKRKDEKKTRYP